MAIELETLEINIEASANGAAKALDELSDSLKKTGKNLDGLNGKEKTVQNVEKNAKQAASAVSNAEQATKKLDQSQGKASSSAKKFNFNLADITKSAGKVQSGISGIFSGLKSGNINNVISGVTSLKSAFGALNKENKKITQTLGGGGISAPKMAFPIEELKGYLKEYKDAGVTAPKWLKDLTVSNIEGNQAEKSKALASYMDQVGDAAKKAGEGMKQVGMDAGDAGEVASASAAGWQGVVAVLGIKVVEAVGKVVIGFEKLKASLVLAPLKALGQRIGQTVGKLGQLFSSLKRVATYRLLRTFLKEITEGFSLGVENAYYFSSVTGGTLAKSLDLIATEFLYLKNSIGAAVAPLINALAPAVEFVVDKFVGLVNIVNQFLSAMGLSTKWIKAVKYPTKYKDALDDATGSAKELKRTILGIDEINPLDDNSDKGKGSNKWDASDYSQMFTYETVAPEIGNFAQGLRDKIEKGDWAGVGSLLAEKVNGLVKKADEKIKWENGLGAKITTWLGNIMTAFNSFLTDFDAKNFGTLIGDAIMTAFNTIDTLVKLTDEKTISDKITQFLNGAFEAIDGKKIGKTLHDTLSKVFTIITNVANGVDKNAIGEDVAGFFEGLNLTDLIKKFKGAFTAVGNLITPVITGSLKGIGSAILSALWEDLTTTDPEGIPGWAKAISFLEGIGQIICGNIKLGILTFFGPKILDALKDELEWVFDHRAEIGEVLKRIDFGEAIIALIAKIELSFKLGWNAMIDKIVEVMRKSSLTAWIGDLLSNAKFDLNKTLFRETGGQAKGFFEQFAQIWNVLGYDSGDKYASGVGNRLKKGIDAGTGNAFSKSITNNVKPYGTGDSNGKNYRLGVSTNIGKYGIKQIDANQFNQNLRKAINPKGNGESQGVSWRTKFVAWLNSPLGEKLAGFKSSLKKAINPEGNGESQGVSWRTKFVAWLNSPLGEKLAGFKSSLRKAINPEGNGTSDAKAYRNAYGVEISKPAVSAGKAFGESIGKNISSGIKAGIKSKKLSINYSMSVNGGSPSTLPVKLTPLPYAEGGIVSGQMFIANEAGPELVGNIGRKTAVANTSQMVDAMATGVYQANAESNMLLRQIIQYAAEIAAKEYSGGGDVTVESITSAMTRNNRRLGKTVVSVG